MIRPRLSSAQLIAPWKPTDVSAESVDVDVHAASMPTIAAIVTAPKE